MAEMPLPQPEPQRPLDLRVSRRVLLLMITLMMAPWVLLGIWAAPYMVGKWTQSWRSLGSRQTVEQEVVSCRPGPWGDLEYTRVMIEPPDAYIPRDILVPERLQWLFRGYSHDALVKLFDEARLTPAQQQELLATTEWGPEQGQVTVRPTKDLILGLSPETRATIYGVLGQWEENQPQSGAFRILAKDEPEWFANSGLPAETIDRVKRLMYRQGLAVMLADLALIIPDIASTEQRERLLKTAWRQSSLLVKLRVKPGTDVDALAAYWGRGQRAKDLKALLDSLLRRPEGYTIDIAHLLPPFPRARLYTFPFPYADAKWLDRDCHWSTMNFFNDPPDDEFLSSPNVRKVLETKYYRVLGEPRFGDLIFMTHLNGKTFHSCVYLADDIVFTKNGPSVYTAWTLTNLDDVRASYPSLQHVEMRVYRCQEY